MAAEPLVPLLESALPSVLKLALERRRISLKNEGAIFICAKCQTLQFKDWDKRSFLPRPEQNDRLRFKLLANYRWLPASPQLSKETAGALHGQRIQKLRIRCLLGRQWALEYFLAC